MNPAGDLSVIKAILFKSHEKLETAQIDFDNGRYNDSVSRSYYAVFHAISAVLLSKGLHFSSHAQTIGAFNKEFIRTKQFPAVFASMIRKLFKERQMGDYDFESYINVNVARTDLEEAGKIVNTSEEYLAKIYNVSKEYWKK